LTVIDLEVDPDNMTRFRAVGRQIHFGGIDNYAGWTSSVREGF
jgi:hypothetical protein